MRRYLPLAVLTTAIAIVLPALLVSATVPRGGLLLMAASALAAVALSIAIVTAGAALWKRRLGSRDVVFSDLLLWGWLRRCWTERRLSQARELFDSARKSGPAISIELVTGLSRLLEGRDPYTHGHGQRVARYAGQIARAMHRSPVEIAKIRTAAAVHDVGKLYTPREILNNPNRLSEAEYEVAKRHAAWGARMLAAVGDGEITAMVRNHHERIDGHGYPDGLAGSDIPIGARIIAVADTFDAITSTRPYRPACPHKRALDVLAEEAGAQLDPAAVAAFRNTYSARRSVAWLALAATVPGRILATLQTATQGLGAGPGGIASILPSVGAAGVLALSPALQHHAFAAHATGSALARRASHASPTAAGSHVPQRIRRTDGAKQTPARYRRSQPTARISPPIRRNNTASPPAVPARGPGAGSHEPAAAAATPPGQSAPPPVTTPGIPTPPPPISPPPPVPPPVTVPSVPGIQPPPVQVPSVPGVGVALPTGAAVATPSTAG
jgi:HD-GYP domain-containing protein (c-di-GMP phosphodiesterase class II)